MWLYFDSEDLAAVKEVLDSGALGVLSGPKPLEALERAFCETFGSPYAAGVCNAMAGLHSAVAAAGAGAGSSLVAPQAVPPGRVSTYHLWGATYEGDRQGLSFDEFIRLAEEKGFRCSWRYLQKPPYLYEVFQEPRAFGRGCPTHCPLRAREARFQAGQCPTAEEVMSRLLLAWTGGSPDDHARAADKLREATEDAG